jgi:hypothetical protein
MAALYGLSAIAIGVATGVAASPDMAGGNVDTLEGISFLPAPPVSVLVDQQLVEKSSVTTDGEKKKQAYTEQELFGISCSVDGDALTLYGTEMKVLLDTPSAGRFCTFFSVVKCIPVFIYLTLFVDLSLVCLVPNRTECKLVALKPGTPEAPLTMNGNGETSDPPAKRIKTENGVSSSETPQDLMAEVERFASILSNTLELD